MKAKVQLRLVLLAAALGALASVACLNQLQSKPAVEQATGSITGTALLSGEEDNSGIIIGAERVEGIKALSVQRRIAGQPPLASKDFSCQTTTDKKGNYCIEGLYPGYYVVTASCNNRQERAVSSYVLVIATKSSQILALCLTLPGEIAGAATLSDASSLPNGNLGIEVYIPGTTFSAITAADGSYKIGGIPAGKNYTLIAEKAGYELAIATVNVAQLTTTTATPFTLAKSATATGTGTITGTAHLADSTSHAGIFVYLEGTSSIAVTDITGAWRLAGVRPGTYTLTASKDAYKASSVNLSLAAGQSLEAGSFSLERIPGTQVGTLGAPLFAPGAGTYPGPQLVTITSSPPGASIYYTVDGTAPTSSYSILYTGPIRVDDLTTIRARAFAPGWTDSPESSASYVLPVATPTFGMPAGSYPEPQYLSLGCVTPGALIRYTRDGSSPSSSSGALYTGPIYLGPIGQGGSIRAIAYKAGRTDSSLALGDFAVESASVSTLAGAPGIVGSGDGTTGNARFRFPEGLACDGGSLYVADASNHTIRAINLSTGMVRTLAGSAGSSGLADGFGSSARFFNPGALAIDGARLYVSDTFNNTIRSVDIATGEVTTIAGMAGASGYADGPGLESLFNKPRGIVSDGSSLYVVDQDNYVVRRIRLADMSVGTLAGSAGSQGSTDGALALFTRPDSLALAGAFLYVSDSGGQTVRRIDLVTGEVSTIAGLAGVSGSADGVGSAARFLLPRGLASDGGDLFVADSDNRTVRKIVLATGAVTTIAGSPSFAAGSADGVGGAARFTRPYGLSCWGSTLYLADSNNTIRSLK